MSLQILVVNSVLTIDVRSLSSEVEIGFLCVYVFVSFFSLFSDIRHLVLYQSVRIKFKRSLHTHENLIYNLPETNEE